MLAAVLLLFGLSSQAAATWAGRRLLDDWQSPATTAAQLRGGEMLLDLGGNGGGWLSRGGRLLFDVGMQAHCLDRCETQPEQIKRTTRNSTSSLVSTIHPACAGSLRRPLKGSG